MLPYRRGELEEMSDKTLTDTVCQLMYELNRRALEKTQFYKKLYNISSIIFINNK